MFSFAQAQPPNPICLTLHPLLLPSIRFTLCSIFKLTLKVFALIATICLDPLGVCVGCFTLYYIILLNQTQTRLKPDLNQAQTRHKPGSNQAQTRIKPDSNQTQTRLKPDLNQTKAISKPDLNQQT